MLVTLAGCAVGGGLLWLNGWANQAGPLGRHTYVQVPSGAGLKQIAGLLVENGVIDKDWPLILWAKLQDTGRNLKAGEYEFRPGMSPEGALNLMRKGEVVIHQVSVPEGFTVAEVIARLDENDRLSGGVWITPPEGSLLPETYNFERGTSRAAMLDRMKVAMDNTVADLWEGRAEDLPVKTMDEAIILASIVEKETSLRAEQPKVAGVFINRLRKGMRLQSDPTVIFALTEGKAPLGRALTRADWKVDHPYNTYQNKGLPPGPIANPGRNAIAAVLNPQIHNYIFFVADGSGGHAFSVTYDEHKRNIERARAARRAARN
ncbi:MAG: endolytic transglycosylase MltG [Alphaproteobacteria bacterium]|nr:endolytic transglycosylase MltG [Alphaproteobacteria bacterium SS10]